MKKSLYLLILLVPVMLLLAVSLPALADITNALYHGTISLSNSDESAVDVSANFSLNSASFIDDGYASDNLSDVTIQYNGIDLAFMPGWGSNPWIVFSPSIGAGANYDIDLYSPNATGGHTYYFPGDGGMTIADGPSLEWGASGDASITAYFNPTSAENILLKTDALKIVGGGDGTVYGCAYNGTSANTTSRPNAAGDLTDLTPSAGANYACAGDNNDTTYVGTTSATYDGDLYNTANHTTERGFIDSVKVYFRYKSNGLQLAYCMPQWKINGVSYNGTEVSTLSGVYTTQSQVYTTSPASGIAWTWDELDGAQIGMWLKSSVYSYCADIWYSVYQAAGVVEVGGVSAGEHTFKMGLSGGTLSLQVDSGTPDTVAFAGTVTDNGNAIVIGDDNITPFIVSASWGVGAALVSAWEWEYGATFQDSIGSNDATPVFRTTSSDGDVSAELTSFLPVSQAEVPDFSLIGSLPELSPPDAVAEMYTESDYIHIPGADSVNEMLDAGGVPRGIWWFPFIYFGICIIGFIVYEATQPKSGGDGSLLTMAIVMEVLITVAGIMNPVPLWPAYLFPIPAMALIVSRKHYSW